MSFLGMLELFNPLVDTAKHLKISQLIQRIKHNQKKDHFCSDPFSFATKTVSPTVVSK